MFVYQQPPGEPILWPLEHEQEAMLLQHYIENIALFVSYTMSISLENKLRATDGNIYSLT